VLGPRGKQGRGREGGGFKGERGAWGEADGHSFKDLLRHRLLPQQPLLFWGAGARRRQGGLRQKERGLREEHRSRGRQVATALGTSWLTGPCSDNPLWLRNWGYGVGLGKRTHSLPAGAMYLTGVS